MKKIYLTGKRSHLFVKVDDEDFELLNKFDWFYCNMYASSYINGYKESNKKQTKMHRFIIKSSNKNEVDHINGDKLDNRKENLRVCTRLENCKNKGFSKNNKSGYKGVYWNKDLKYWVAQIDVDGKHYSKYLKNKLEAALTYNELAKKYHGEFALLNKV